MASLQRLPAGMDGDDGGVKFTKFVYRSLENIWKKEEIPGFLVRPNNLCQGGSILA